MSDKNKVRRYDAEVMALPPLKMVLGDVPSPDPHGRRNGSAQKPDPELEVTVLKLIARLKDQEH